MQEIGHSIEKVVVVQRVLPHYGKPVFDRLAAMYNMTLLHGEVTKAGYNEVSAPYSIRVPFFQYSNSTSHIFLFALGKIKKIKPAVIIYENSVGILSLPFTMIYSRLKGIKFILWGHGYNRDKGFYPQSSVLDKIRLWYMRMADAVLFYGQEGKVTLSQYIDSNKLFVAPNTLDTDALLKIKEELALEGKENIKKRLGITFKYNIIYVGRLLKSKYPEKLLVLFKYFSSTIQQDIGIHYVGDGEMKYRLQEISVEMGCERNVVFHGAIYDDKRIGEYLFVSDLMIQPGAMGLAINHAFCFECPVVSFESQMHGPEIEYLIPNQTGYLAKMDQYTDMSAWVEKYLSDAEMQLKIKSKINYMVQNVCSIRQMLAGIKLAVEYTLSKKLN